MKNAQSTTSRKNILSSLRTDVGKRKKSWNERYASVFDKLFK